MVGSDLDLGYLGGGGSHVDALHKTHIVFWGDGVPCVVQGGVSAGNIRLWLWRLHKGRWKRDGEEGEEGHLFQVLVLFLRNGPDALPGQNAKPLEFVQR